MRVSRWGSSWGRCPRRDHVSHASRWNPVPLSSPRRRHPVPFSSNRRSAFGWNPVCLGPRWSGKSPWKPGPYWSWSKAFFNRCRGHWPWHPHLFKPRRRSLLRTRKGALRDMWYRGWCGGLRWKTTDHWMLLTRTLHEKRFARYCGYSRKMATIHDRYSGNISKGPVTRQNRVRGYCWKDLAQWGRKEGYCLRKHGSLYLVVSLLSSITLASPLLSLMTSLDVRLQVSLGEITPTASRDSIAASANWTHVHTAQRCALDPLNTISAPEAKFDVKRVMPWHNESVSLLSLTFSSLWINAYHF